MARYRIAPRSPGGLRGYARTVQCQACGRQYDPDARFCSMCGASLAPGAQPVIAEETRSQVMSSLRGEERLVTVVFADLTESVSRTSGLSPEEAKGLVSPLLEAMAELMIRYGGRIDRFLGDGVLAVFGVPTAHEDDPIRAVRAALDLRERAVSLDLAVTVGINTGRVYFGPVGSDLHEEITVMGPTVNLAARLQSAAAPGQILVGESTRAHVEAAFHLIPISLDVKGVDGPVSASRVEDLVDHPDKVRGIRGLRADLVGRDEELRLLRESLDGPGQTFALVGPAGVGKSRLAAELHRHVGRDGAIWLEGRCLELTRHIPYGPFIDMLGRQLGPNPSQALVDSFDEMISIGAVLPERSDEVFPFLVHLLGGSLGDHRDSRVLESSPDQRRALTVDALLEYLGAMARAHPTVVLLDDVHWSDDPSKEVIHGLHKSGDPMVLVLSYRPASGVELRLDSVSTLRLEELTSTESRELIGRLLNVSGLPASVESAIVENSGGNPFYVEEIIRTFIQRGIIGRRNGSWEVTGSLDDLPLPESIEGVVMSRFDRLPAELRQASRLASVLSGSFTRSVFSALGGGLVAALPGMVDAGLVREERRVPEREYTFVHALTRQAIYSSLLPSQRAELHEKAAAALEELRPEDVDRLAFHYQRSKNHRKAVEWSYQAAERAMDAFVNDLALSHLDDGWGRIAHLSEDEQPRWRARYRARKGELLERDADHEAARTELEAALKDLADDPYEEARIWALIGKTHRLQARFDDAHRSYDRAEAAIGRVSGPETPPTHRVWIDIQKERAYALYFGGRGKELPAHNAKVRPVVEAHGSAAQQTDFLRGVLLDEFIKNRWVLDAEAVALARRALEVAMAGADPGRIAESRFGLGFALLWADEVEEAAQVLQRAVVENIRVGDRVHENRARAYLAIALRRAGRVVEAEEAAKASLDTALGLADSYYQGHAHSVLCWVDWRLGTRKCRGTGRAAMDAWGTRESDEYKGLGTEFAWLVVWPLAADARQRMDYEEAADYLRLLMVPWERPLPPDLATAVEDAVEDPDALDLALELAERYLLL